MENNLRSIWKDIRTGALPVSQIPGFIWWAIKNPPDEVLDLVTLPILFGFCLGISLALAVIIHIFQKCISIILVR